jgi:hypothetical protein
VGSPGGNEVARISVKVLPDTSGFAQKLKADLSKINEQVTVEVNFDVDVAGLIAALEALKLPKITVPVGFEDIKDASIEVTADTTKATQEVDAEVAKINAKKATIKLEADTKAIEKARFQALLDNMNLKVKFDLDMAGFLAQEKAAMLAAEKIGHVKVKMDVDRSAFDKVTTSIGRALSSTFSTASKVASGVFGAMADGLGAVATAAGTIGPLILQAAGYGFLFAEAGAGVTAAWGAVSAAIVAIPAAVGLLGAPIAAVALGMDGIKKAAATIKPQFEAMKKSISDTFQKGLTPVLQNLAKNLFPALTVGLKGTATSLTGLAAGMGKFLTSTAGLTLVKTLFTNVNAALKTINLVPLVDGFLKLAGTKSALDAIVGTINTLGTSFDAMVTKISNNGTLDAAMKGLQTVLGAVTQGFMDLVSNGITVFANAAPGVTSAIESITGFFDKINWATIGQAVGTAFKGLGDAVKNIPQSTIDGIVQGFKDLGDALGGPEVQNFITTMSGVLPGVLTSLGGLIRTVADLGVRMTGVFKLFNDFSNFDPTTLFGSSADWQKVSDDIDTITTGVPPKFDAAFNQIPGIVGASGAATEAQMSATFGALPAKAASDLTPLVSTVKTGVAGVPGAMKAGLSPVLPQTEAIFKGISPAAQAGLGTLPPIIDAMTQPIPGQVESNVAPTPDALNGVWGAVINGTVAGLSPLASLVYRLVGQTPIQAAAAAAGTPTATAAAVNPTTGAVQKVLSTLGPTAGAEAGKIAPAVGAGLKPLPEVAKSALGQLDPAFLAAFQGLASGATTGMGTIAQAVAAGVIGVGTALTAGLVALGPSVTGAFQGLANTAGVGIGLISVAMSQQMTGLTTVFSTAFTALSTTAITPAFQAMAAQAAIGIGLIGIAIQGAMPGLTTVLMTAFTALGTTAIIPAFAAINTTIIPAQMAAMGVAVTTGITTSIVPAFTTGFAALGTTAIAPAFATLATTAIPQGIAALGAAFTTGFATVLTPIILAAFTALGTTAIVPGFTAWGTVNVPLGLAAFGVSLTTGFATVLTPIILAAFTALGTTAIVPGFIAWGTVNVPLGLAALGLAFTTGFATILTPIILAAFTALGTTAFIPGFASIVTTAITPGIATWGTAITTGFTTVLTPAVTAGMAALATAVTTGAAPVVENFNTMITAIQDALQVLVDNMATIGDNITTALANAITAGQSKVVNAIVAMVQAALAAAFAVLGINSPSKEFQYIGKSIPEGTEKGVLDNKMMAVNAVTTMGAAMVQAGQNLAPIPGPALDSAWTSATGSAINGVLADSGSVLGGDGAAAGGGVGGNTFNIQASSTATAVQLANQVIYQTKYSRRGVHSGR